MPTNTHTWMRGGGGGGSGGRLRDARTFTAATFFAHLLTLRMFRVYFFNPVTLRKDKKREKERGRREDTLPPVFISFLFVSCFFFVFFVLTVTPAWNRVIPTGMGVRGHFAWRVQVQEAVHTYFAFTTAKLKRL